MKPTAIQLMVLEDASINGDLWCVKGGWTKSAIMAAGDRWHSPQAVSLCVREGWMWEAPHQPDRRLVTDAGRAALAAAKKE